MFVNRPTHLTKILLQQQKLFEVMENKLTKKMEKMEGKIDSLVNLVQRQEEQIQQQQQRFLQQLQDQQQQFLFQQQQQQQQEQQEQQQEQQQQQPQKQLQRQQQQPQEQQQQLQETTSSPHQPSFSLMDPFITSAEVSSYLSILNNDKPAAALNPQKKIPCSNHLAKEIFHQNQGFIFKGYLININAIG